MSDDLIKRLERWGADAGLQNHFIGSRSARKDCAEAAERIAELEAALLSIARNTCCGPCQEAAAVARVRALQGDPRWHVGVSFGEVTGDLRAVLDERGEQEFVIHPAVGADRIVCKFTAEQRALMSNYLFRVVTVAGKLHYGEDSPHPKFVEMHSIREKSPSPTHLLDLRGLFSGLEKPALTRS